MNSTQKQETEVSNAFSKQSAVFDTITTSNPMEVLYRDITRKHVMQFVQPNQTMLELNCGTGLDAFFFAEQGLTIHATDNANGMLEQLHKKIIQSHNTKITFEKCSFNNLVLQNTNQQFDHVFSNFGGLNCADNISEVIQHLNSYVKKGGMVHLVLIAPICLWEWATVFKGKYKFAFRRLTKKGVKSHLEGHYFMTYYYSPKDIKKAFGKQYECVELKSLGCFLPPTFNDYFPAKHPKLFNTLKKMELKTHNHWPFNRIGDLFIISMRKK